MARRHETYAEYWEAYLEAHWHPATRACHYLATLYGAALGGVAALTGEPAWLAAGIAGGYALAVGSHFVFQGNRPLLHHPLWGWISDLRMCALALTGRLPAGARRGAV